MRERETGKEIHSERQTDRDKQRERDADGKEERKRERKRSIVRVVGWEGVKNRIEKKTKARLFWEGWTRQKMAPFLPPPLRGTAIDGGR